MKGIKSIGKLLSGVLPESTKTEKKKGKTGKGRNVLTTDLPNYVENGSEDSLVDASHKKKSFKKLAPALNVRKKSKKILEGKKKKDDSNETTIDGNNKTIKEADNESLVDRGLLNNQPENQRAQEGSSSEGSGIGDDDQGNNFSEQGNDEVSGQPHAELTEEASDGIVAETDSAYGRNDQALDADAAIDEIDSESIRERIEQAVVAESNDVKEGDLQDDLNILVSSAKETILDLSPRLSEDTAVHQSSAAGSVSNSIDVELKKKKKSKKVGGMLKAILGKKKEKGQAHHGESTDISSQTVNKSTALDVVHKKTSQPKQVAKTVNKLASAIRRPQDAIGIHSKISDTTKAVKFVSDVVRGDVSPIEEKEFHIKAKSFKSAWLANHIRKLKKESNLNSKAVNEILFEKRNIMERYMPMIDCMIEWSQLSGENKRAESLRLLVINLKENIAGNVSREDFKNILYVIDETLVKLDKIVSGGKTKKYLLDVKPKKNNSREEMLRMLFKEFINIPLDKIKIDRFSAISNYLLKDKEDSSDKDQLYFDIMKVFYDDYNSMSNLVDSNKEMLAVCDFVDQYMKFQQIDEDLVKLRSDVDSLRSYGYSLESNIENDIDKSRAEIEWFSNVAAKGRKFDGKLKKNDLRRKINSLRESVSFFRDYKKQVEGKAIQLRRANVIIPAFVAEVKSCEDEVYQTMERDEHEWHYQVSSLKDVKLENAFLNKILPKRLARRLVGSRIVSLDKKMLKEHSSKVVNFKKLSNFLGIIRQHNIRFEGIFDNKVIHKTYSLLAEMLSKNQISEGQASKLFDSLFKSESLASSINKIDFGFLVSADADSLDRVKNSLSLYDEHINESINILKNKVLKSKRLNVKTKKLRVTANKVKTAQRVLAVLKGRGITKASLLSILNSISVDIDHSLVDKTDKVYIESLKSEIDNLKMLGLDGHVSSVNDETVLNEKYDGSMAKASINKELLGYLKRDRALSADEKDRFHDAELKLYEAEAYIKLWSSLSVKGTAYDKLPRDMHRVITATMESANKIKEKMDCSDRILSGKRDTARMFAHRKAIVGVASRLKIAEDINRESIVVMANDFPPIETLVEMGMLKGLVKDRVTFINKWKDVDPELLDIINKKYKLVKDEASCIDDLNYAEKENAFVVNSLLNAYESILNDALAVDLNKIKSFLSISVIGHYFKVNSDDKDNPVLIRLDRKYVNNFHTEKLVDAINHESKTEDYCLDIHQNVMNAVIKHKDLRDKLDLNKEDDGRDFLKLKDGAVHSLQDAVNSCQSLWEEFPVDLIYFVKRRQAVLKNLKEKIQQVKDKGKHEKARLLISAYEKIEALSINTPKFIKETHKILNQLYTDLKGRRKLVRRAKSDSNLVQDAKKLITYRECQNFVNKFLG